MVGGTIARENYGIALPSGSRYRCLNLLATTDAWATGVAVTLDLGPALG